MRVIKDPQQLVSIWAGVAAAFVMILFGWWWAAKPEYASLFSRTSDSGVQELKQEATRFGEKTRSDLEEATRRLSALESELRRREPTPRETTLEEVAKLVNAHAAGSLFAPSDAR